jgi:hypothetical protein
MIIFNFIDDTGTISEKPTWEDWGAGVEEALSE